MSAVAFRDVVKLFSDGAVTAVDRVSFEVEDGELLVLLGPSGCGKTTSLRMIAGLEEPDAGDISIGGRVVSSASSNIFVPTEKRNLGMVFQSYAIWPHMTVFENVAYPLKVRGVAKKIIAQKVSATLALIGLEGYENRPAPALSGGQQQRVALARALVFEPRILLLDEPLSNLDAKLRVHMRAELKQLQRQTGITSIFVTHDQAESMSLADRIIVMNRGRIEQIGTPQEIYEQPRSHFVSEFVGSINMLPAQVLEATPDDCVLLNADWSEDVVRSSSAQAGVFRASQTVFASIRPERLKLARQRPNGGTNSWECSVTSAAYFGDHWEYVLTAREREISVVAGHEVHASVGERVFITCDPADVVLLPREVAS
ncbi:MAG TPA: ABC transporter ATP-binding protein [Chloroflexota bacterium]|jgi:iron(III) transport system ATP-binding protein|nr:ABC transporter ATP-binding protein [Chloroflexota bacterium]